jgi:hypothetical protein
MSPPDARAGARLRVATMFTGAGAIDYGCVARDARRRDGAGNAGNAARTPNERERRRRRIRRATTTTTTRDDARSGRHGEDGARRREGARDGSPGRTNARLTRREFGTRARPG